MRVPWRDRHGRFLPLKAAVLALVLVPGAVNAFWWSNADLGGRPITELIHASGLWAVRLILIALAITSFARILNLPRLLMTRRIVGVSAMTYALIHLTLYVVDQKFALGVVVSEIALRFYLTIGFIALIGLVALGVTSTDDAIRRLGRRWKNLHRLVYPIAALAILHYFIQSKANVSEPVFVAGLWVWLMVWRVLPDAWRRPLAVYPVLAVVAGLATAGVEFAWYGIATNIDPWRVLAANESISYGLRPAHWVFVAGVAAAVLVAVRRFADWRSGGRLSGGRSSYPIPARTGRGS
ncbi:MAG: sulfite oxidase heme-binding subunit YedZ [Acetobacteraceae bacterium]